MAHLVSVTGDAGAASRYAEDDRLQHALLDETRGRPRDVTTSTWDMDLLQELVESSEPVGADEEKVVQIDQLCESIGVRNSSILRTGCIPGTRIPPHIPRPAMSRALTTGHSLYVTSRRTQRRTPHSRR